MDDVTLVAFKTEREREVQLGREYQFEPMGVGECRVVQDDASAADGAKEGQIVFLRQGPLNLLPYVRRYEQLNRERHNGRQKPILEGKHRLSDRALRNREQLLINAYVNMPCRVSFIPERYGKMPHSMKNVIYMEYDNYLQLLAEYLPDPLDQN